MQPILALFSTYFLIYEGLTFKVSVPICCPLRSLLEDLHQRYPKALIVGHCDLEPRKPHCPGFNVSSELSDLFSLEN